MGQSHLKQPIVRPVPSPLMYLTIFGLWIFSIVWFHSRLWQLLQMANDFAGTISLGAFIFFIYLAWLYGIYNAVIVGFSILYRYLGRKPQLVPMTMEAEPPAVAILYTTYNDFVERSAMSCVQQDYSNYKVYILDDSTNENSQAIVDEFARRYKDKVAVIRRNDRVGFKAGNLNHGLQNAAVTEPYFAIVDADEVLCPDFLSRLVPTMDADEQCGFIQANHRSHPDAPTALAKSLGIGIDIHWEWYQPLRNDYGFVMFLGHGALLRRSCWEEVGGFPHLVSEDLAYAIEIRERGYRGLFAEDVICYEDFPETVRAFRIRHMKWTRGTCEFLANKLTWILRAKNISWAEKCDVIFPTFNLPLTMVYLLFMVNANLFLPMLFGEFREITYVLSGREIHVPFVTLNQSFAVIHGVDFLAITLLTFFSPVLCFVLALALRPIRLLRFLCHSTSLYAALSPLSSIGVISYLISGKAVFLVTGDTNQTSAANPRDNRASREPGRGIVSSLKKTLVLSHPDNRLIQIMEIAIALSLGVMSVVMIQISFMGLCLAFLLLPVMHHIGWENRFSAVTTYLPFLMILTGIALAFGNMLGMQSVFFGYGFHF